jgi:tRNA threonylcarbamoyladenosine biosynthesis protein TsaE
MTIDIPDLAAMQRFGQTLGSMLFPGAVVALMGDLGAGKTHLVQAIAAGLGVSDPRAVSSPTFTLIQEYAARLPIYHFDVYRLKSEAEFEDLGAHEYLLGAGVCLVEWAERVMTLLPPERLSIAIEILGSTSRRLSLIATGSAHRTLIQNLNPLNYSCPSAAR